MSSLLKYSMVYKLVHMAKMLIKIVNIIKRNQTPVDIIHWDINNYQSSIYIDKEYVFYLKAKETVKLISLSLRKDMQTCTYSKFAYKSKDF